MTAGNGVDPVLSMSLFKSPDCAQQVFSKAWLTLVARQRLYVWYKPAADNRFGSGWTNMVIPLYRGRDSSTWSIYAL